MIQIIIFTVILLVVGMVIGGVVGFWLGYRAGEDNEKSKWRSRGEWESREAITYEPSEHNETNREEIEEVT